MWSVVTTGVVNSRNRVNQWLADGPPKIPNSCWTEATSTLLAFKKAAARRYEYKVLLLNLGARDIPDTW